jgi:hypothetical protein
MLKLIDSGCERHQPRQFRLNGSMATLVSHLLLNLPPSDAGHTYICEHGHTHCLTLPRRQAVRPSTRPGLGYAGGTALTH